MQPSETFLGITCSSLQISLVFESTRTFERYFHKCKTSIRLDVFSFPHGFYQHQYQSTLDIRFSALSWIFMWRYFSLRVWKIPKSKRNIQTLLYYCILVITLHKIRWLNFVTLNAQDPIPFAFSKILCYVAGF